MADYSAWQSWTTEDVGAWLEAEGLPEFVGVFAENEIDGDALEGLDHDMLKELGFDKVGPRSKMMKRVRRLAEGGASGGEAGLGAGLKRRAIPLPKSPRSLTGALSRNGSAPVLGISPGDDPADTSPLARSGTLAPTAAGTSGGLLEPPGGDASPVDSRSRASSFNSNSGALSGGSGGVGTSSSGGRGGGSDGGGGEDEHPLQNAWKTGYLTKEGGKRKSWKRRWFVLKDYVLYYFKNESLATDPKNALGRFPIPSYEVDFSDKKPFAFQVSHANCRTYYFSADSKEDMLAWMKAIREGGLATAAKGWFVAEARHYTVKENDAEGRFDVEMDMDPMRSPPGIVAGATYRYRCKWIPAERRGAEGQPIYIEVTSHSIQMIDTETERVISVASFPHIQRYAVDAEEPVFSIVTVVEGVKALEEFHMGNRNIANHCNEALTLQLQHLAAILREARG